MATDTKPEKGADLSKLSAADAARLCIRLARAATRAPEIIPARHHAAQLAASSAADAIVSAIEAAFKVRE